MRTVTIGTRRSRLARIQTDSVKQQLLTHYPELTVRVVEVVTEGDMTDGPLSGGGKGLFTSALEKAILEDHIDFAVHSLKDLPVESAEGLTVGAVTQRETARDVLLSRDHWTMETIPEGATVGTSSLRRQAQLMSFRPDLVVQPIRGNVDTRIKKMQRGDVDALVLAEAGLVRMSIPHNPDQLLPFEVMLPAPGQGALAVQCREDDEPFLRVLECPDSRSVTTAERTFLQTLGGGCAMPIAAYAWVNTGGLLSMEGLVATIDGRRAVRAAGMGHDPVRLGKEIADDALSRGAGALLHGD